MNIYRRETCHVLGILNCSQKSEEIHEKKGETMLHLFKKSTALLLVISMLLGPLCLPAFADVTQDKPDYLDYLFSTTVPKNGDDGNDLVAGDASDLPEVPRPERGYTHVYLGLGNESIYWSGFTYKYGEGEGLSASHNGYTDDKFGTVHNLKTTYKTFVR